MKQAERLGALLSDYGIFPDANLGVKNKAHALKKAYQLAAKIANSDKSVSNL